MIKVSEMLAICIYAFIFNFLCIYKRHQIMFKIKADQLTPLFDRDNIVEGRSLQMLLKWGKLEGLQQALGTSIKQGRNDAPEVQSERIKTYGDNSPIVKPPKTLLSMILQNFEDVMLRVLCAAAVVSLILGIATQGIQHGWMEGASILVAVIIIVTVTSGNNWMKQRQFRKLNEIAAKKYVNVLRNGDWVNISANQLLVGDIQYIETGEIVSVDGILTQSFNVIADQSAMTGQNIQIKKRVPKDYKLGDPSPFLISGSKILQGSGSMLVLAVGRRSQYGILKTALQSEQDETPLQHKLSLLAQQIGKVGMYAAILTFICMLGHIIHGAFISQNFVSALFSVQSLHNLVDAFIVSVSIIVVAVPQGLPLAVTIALAYSVGKMKDENNLVRYLQACQTMGGADNICSDKTGTLTKNIMSVTRMWALEKQYDSFETTTFPESFSKILCKSICFNSNATPDIREQNSGLRIVQIGNKTECALLELAHKLGYSYKSHRNKDNIVRIHPFSSNIKSMSTTAQLDGENYTFSKGAPDFMIKQCTNYVNAEGQTVPITPDFIENLNKQIQKFAQLTLRTLLIGYKKGGDVEDSQDKAFSELTVLALVGIKDPIRDEIAGAVKVCNQAGVRVRMITGDNQKTAIAIAKEAGILEPGWQPKQNDCTVMVGKHFRQYVGGLINANTDQQTVGDMQHFKNVAQNLRVLARSSPSDKYLMATGLKRLNHVVAMTGDGTNDAPALKRADIGFAMGITGTEVAKQASGIILLDDNFNSIVTAMKWGRNIFDSIRKFLQFQLTVNFSALILAFTGAAFLKQSPLTPIQMLWVNLIMDTLAALALATEPPSDELLHRRPYSRFEGLITAQMWRNIIAQGMLQVVILGTILFRGPQIFGIQSSIGLDHNTWNNQSGKHYSIFFNVFVLLQVFNEINCRKLKTSELNVFANFFNNPLFIIIMISTLVIQYLCVQLGGQSLRTVPLTTSEHCMCLGISCLPIIAGFFFKILIPASLFDVLVKISSRATSHQKTD